jgi:hypothetical protein
MNTTTIGVDVAKTVFQVSLANRSGRILSRRRLSRSGFERFLCEQPEADVVLEVERRTHHNKATIALTNKLGRIIWSVWSRDEEYRAHWCPTSPCHRVISHRHPEPAQGR